MQALLDNPVHQDQGGPQVSPENQERLDPQALGATADNRDTQEKTDKGVKRDNLVVTDVKAAVASPDQLV